MIKRSPPSFPRRRGPCPPVLLWRCRPPSQPRPPATQRARAASPAASDSLSHPEAPGNAAPPKSRCLRDLAEVGVLQVRVHWYQAGRFLLDIDKTKLAVVENDDLD